jgi:hypothetical protein
VNRVPVDAERLISETGPAGLDRHPMPPRIHAREQLPAFAPSPTLRGVARQPWERAQLIIFKQLTINLDIYISIFQVGLANLRGKAKNEHGRDVGDAFPGPDSRV